MLTILTGRANSGKSEKMLTRIRTLGDTGKQILMVPQYATHGAEVELCTVCGDTTARHAEVLSFESLAERVLAIVGGSALQTLDDGGRLLTMQKTLQEVGSSLRFFRRSFLKSAFLADLVSLADEFRSYCVTPEALIARAEEIGGNTGLKLYDLALITGTYEAKLFHDHADARDRVSRMAEKLEESGYVQDKDIFLDGFSYFNAQEERALSVMLRQARSLTVTMLFDENDQSGIFDETALTIERLKRLAKENGSECVVEHCNSKGNQTALAFLEQNFFGIGAEFKGESREAIRILRSNSAAEEAAAVAGEICRLVHSGFRYREIGITVRNLSEYRQTLETVLRRYGIPYFLNQRSDILEKPLVTLLCAVLESVTGGYEYEDMFRWLKTGLAGLSDEECDLLENYVIRWEIRGSMWVKDTPWIAHPDGYGAEWTDAAKETLAEINALRERVRKPLAMLKDGLKESKDAREMVMALYCFLENLSIPDTMEEKACLLQEQGEVRLAEEYSQLWNILCSVMDQFVEILGEHQLETEEFSRLFRLILTQYHVGSIPVALDQVKISSMTQNDRQTVKCLFLMGANDSVIPSSSTAAGLLTEEDRELVQEGGIRLAPGAEAHFAMELQNLYAALAQPSERLTVSYPAMDVSGSELRPSFIVPRLCKLFPDLSVQQTEESCLTAAAVPALETAGCWQNGRLWQYFEEKGGYEDALSAMRRASETKRGRLSPEAVELLYGKKLRMSASRMDKVRQCHYAYFLQYGLKAKEREEAKFDAPQIGTFLHYLLENVTRDVQAQGGFTAVADDTLKTLTQHYVSKYISEELSGLKDKNARFRYLFRRLRESAERIVKSLAEELRNSDFVPVAFELEFSNHGEIPAISIYEGEKALQVSGKVDRVDGWLHDGKMYLRVVDYKTGKKKFDLADVRYGLNLQMLLYLFTLQNAGEGYFGYPIEPAGVLYMPAREELLSLPKTVGKEELKKKMDRTLRRTGLVLSDPLVLHAMEHSALESPSYLPMRVTKDGTLSGSIADAEKLGILGKHVERQLREIMREMYQGTIDADPCCRNEDDTACRFCEFRSACHFEDGKDRDRLRYIRPITDMSEFWDEMCERVEGGMKQ